MPTGGRANAKIDHIAAEIIRLPLVYNRLPRPGHSTAGPTRYRRRRVHRLFFKLTYFEYAHLTSQV